MSDAKGQVAIKSLEGASLTITVTVTRGFRVRVWVAAKLLALAGRVLKADSKIDIVDTSKATPGA